MKLPNKAYDILKWIAQILLPAVATLYFALAQIWGFPYGEEIVGTISAIDVFLGVCLGISTMQYNKEQQQTLVDGVGSMDLYNILPVDQRLSIYFQVNIMVYRENELMHYGVKGMKWHKHLKRHEKESLRDRLGYDEGKDLHEATKQRQAAEGVYDDHMSRLVAYRKGAENDRTQYRKTGKKFYRDALEEHEGDARVAQYWQKKMAEDVIDKRRREQIAQWRYDRTVMGKIDKGKRKIAEFLKRGFKK